MDQSTVGFEAKRSKICQICATVSENYHLNYGVPTCLSCRAFFRRTVQTKVESLECSKSGNCAMIPKSRKNCRKCRLERCYKAGMDPNLVMDEQAKRSRFRNVKSKKRLDSEQSGAEPVKNVASQSASIVPEHSAPPAWIHNEFENSGKPMESDE
ncbi:hypothetical protein TCAL_11844 [Tigriopus californicus]|uniref:Nuclear receptor domain-containing protein n=1 Tax=Tigriopus californicus TaxID=6832 RepID=A0A553PU20_TIGCA|nr:nuclear hormone receptor family member nhr-111-like [Tigriopus californicus]TRY81175.1 hypothetical protein TCAL_11844 [Tigriopus californicus]|eukprot:TCALIF_11844-PA protein Name:"Similar to Esrrb Steroid hormone receptor ERR2 (Rattus norvegicus)" AED:0.24 eAED:0.25 QI:0/-1/0/1/-1/1/1/0/154